MSQTQFRRLALALIATAITIAVGWFAWWWTHPTLFGGGGGGVGVTSPLPMARAHVTVGLIDPPSSGDGTVVRLTGARANFAAGSAAATVSFQVCHGSPIGLVYDPTPYCRELRDLPTSFRYVPGSSESLVMTVRATTPGEVKISSESVDYRQGGDELWQQGSSTIPLAVTFTAR